MIRLKLSFRAVKNSNVAFQEHVDLLQILLLHELQTFNVPPYFWSGKFSEQGKSIVLQHYAQTELDEKSQILAQWTAYTMVHSNHQFSFDLFVDLLEKIMCFMSSTGTNTEDIKLFWEGVTKLLPSCFSIIRNTQNDMSNGKNAMIKDVLQILSIISKQTVPDDVDLFPNDEYGYEKFSFKTNYRPMYECNY